MTQYERDNRFVYDKYEDQIVHFIRVHVQLFTDEEGHKRNHWTIYLCNENKEYPSIRLDITGRYRESKKGTFIFKAFPDNKHRDVEYFDLQIAKDRQVEVGMIYRLVMEMKRDNVVFDEGGSGCRFWWQDEPSFPLWWHANSRIAGLCYVIWID